MQQVVARFAWLACLAAGVLPARSGLDPVRSVTVVGDPSYAADEGLLARVARELDAAGIASGPPCILAPGDDPLHCLAAAGTEGPAHAVIAVGPRAGRLVIDAVRDRRLVVPLADEISPGEADRIAAIAPAVAPAREIALVEMLGGARGPRLAVVDRGLPGTAAALRAALGEQAVREVDGRSAERVVSAVPRGPATLFVGPLPGLDRQALSELFERLAARGVLAVSIDRGLQPGLGAALGGTRVFDLDRLARRTVAALLEGAAGPGPDDAGAEGPRAVLDTTVLARLGIEPPDPLVDRAELLGGLPVPEGPQLSLEELVRAARAASRPLAVAGSELVTAQARRAGALAALRPRVEGVAGGVLVDGDLSDASLGLVPERTAFAGIVVVQPLFSDELLARLRIAGDRQRAAEAGMTSVRRDVDGEALRAGFALLAARRIELIRHDAVQRARDSLELARRREAAGAAGPADALQAEARLAATLAELEQARAGRRGAEVALARLAGRPPGERLRLVEPRAEEIDADLSRQVDDLLAAGDGQLRAAAGPLVERAREESAMRDRLEAGLAAARRAEKTARRAGRVPDVFLFGEWLRAEADGPGSDLGALLGTPPIPGLPPLVLRTPEAPDEGWSVQLVARLGLLTGGARAARRRAARAERTRVETRLGEFDDGLAARIHVALARAVASRRAVRHAERAAASAGRAAAVVEDAYARGAVRILELLDAQRRAFEAGERAATARIVALIDFVDLHRALARDVAPDRRSPSSDPGKEDE